jgi:hypothetical protein
MLKTPDADVPPWLVIFLWGNRADVGRGYHGLWDSTILRR